MTIQLTRRVHLQAHARRLNFVYWDILVGSYVESVRPFKGYWLTLTLGLGWWGVFVYVGE